MDYFKEIGRGTFGIIFTIGTQAQAGENVKRVLKRTLLPNIDPQKWLEQEAIQHEAISAALADIKDDGNTDFLSLPCVPKFFGIIDREHSWWSMHGNTRRWVTHSKGNDCDSIDCPYTCPSPAISAQQIPSISRRTALSLLAKYAPVDSKAASIVRSEMSCDISILLRPYFGQSTPVNLKGTTSLHNFPLYRDRLTAILSSADRIKALEIIASALAFLHWHVQCDAKDVEFVFGGLNPLLQEQNRPVFEIFGGKCHMWLLDFNQVERITMDVGGVEKAVLGYENDPYYPKPDSDRANWSTFRNRYLTTSSMLAKASLDNHQDISDRVSVADLSRMFVNRVEDNSGLNRGQRALDFATADDTAYSVGMHSLWAAITWQIRRWL